MFDRHICVQSYSSLYVALAQWKLSTCFILCLPLQFNDNFDVFNRSNMFVNFWLQSKNERKWARNIPSDKATILDIRSSISFDQNVKILIWCFFLFFGQHSVSWYISNAQGFDVVQNEVNPIETTYENSGLLDLKVKRLKRHSVTTRRWTYFRLGLA